jgi:hypothetical protein
LRFANRRKHCYHPQAPDGGYPGANTAEGQNALHSLTTGGYNTALGYLSLGTDTTGNYNTGVGAGALLANTGPQNTAVGAGALLRNAGGGSNTAIGTLALFNNTVGNGNIGIGVAAGRENDTGSDNIYIGGVTAVAGENSVCRIRNIIGSTAVGGSQVFVTSGDLLGTNTSSRRFKEAITPIDKASEVLFALKPVSFRYKKEIDPRGTPEFGLVAEDVEKLSPELVVRDKEGKPYSVRYEQVNAMLLNEFLKEHKTVQEQGATIKQQRKDFEAAIAQQQKQIDVLGAALQKVSAQLEVSKFAPQTVLNNQ